MVGRRLLIVTSDFPPLVGTNTQRVISFVRHLPRSGWETTVLTRAIRDLETIDSRDIAGIPEQCTVTRIEDPDFFAARRRRIGHEPDDVAQQGSRPHTPTGHSLPSSHYSGNSIIRALRETGSRVLKTSIRYLAHHPDALRLWADAAAKTVVKSRLTQTHDALLTSAPSYSSHVAGLKIKRKTSLPWVADFRDLWVGRPFRPHVSRWHDWMDRRLEDAVVRECDVLLLASPAWRSTFVERYGAHIEQKIVVLTNGYDSDEMDSVHASAPRSETSVRRFVLTGSMHEAESPMQFIRAVGALRRNAPSLAAQVRADFIGNGGEHTPELEAALLEENIADLVHLHGPRSHVECLKAQSEADFLFMASAPEHRDTLRGKSFEYMATGKPILACLTADSIQARLLNEAGTMRRVNYGDVDETEDAIKCLLTSDNSDLSPNWSVIRSYERSALASELAKTLDQLIMHRTRG